MKPINKNKLIFRVITYLILITPECVKDSKALIYRMTVSNVQF